MRVTVLGSAASHAGRGEACAGHLVEGGGARVLFDCGNGVLANLYEVSDPRSLDAIFVTHNHPDHYADVYSMQSMLRYAPGGPVDPVALYMPAMLYDRMQSLLSDRGAEEFRAAFRFTPLVDRTPIQIAQMTVTPHPVEHTDPTFALVADADGARLVYTSDTAPGERVRVAAEGADLLLAEATLPECHAGDSPHLSAREAGELARDVAARQLVLVHVWPTNDRGEALREASEAFGGPVSVSREFDVFDVIPREEAL